MTKEHTYAFETGYQMGLKEAEDEVARLRESNDMLAKLLGDRTADCYKLRELARDLWKSCPVYTADCYGCEHHVGGECEMPGRMRELGIETGQ